ncbi:hypothetical protein Syun_001264 [Stephania yunnanensis]|uniref:Uncharacterized protein n=1 Tax=Stephania yunnanensis TaxID=152371 RepID=A0AAP0LHH1_9MAGN
MAMPPRAAMEDSEGGHGGLRDVVHRRGDAGDGEVRDWIDRINRDRVFRRIIPAHFAAPINASRSEFLAAFGFLDDLLAQTVTQAQYLNQAQIMAWHA